MHDTGAASRPRLLHPQLEKTKTLGNKNKTKRKTRYTLFGDRDEIRASRDQVLAAQNQIRNTRKQTFANQDQLPPGRGKREKGGKGREGKNKKNKTKKTHAVWCRMPPAPHSTDEEPRPGSCKSRECDGCGPWEAPASTRAQRVWGLAGG